ncbi:hypothetical protein [Streptomyces sp. NPDC006551]|uniref:hypothetical protein n=1 Tax=Streptomyces sp. NPDC006551 TaxID=3157178 RepID=UPI0033B5D3B9
MTIIEQHAGWLSASESGPYSTYPSQTVHVRHSGELAVHVGLSYAAAQRAQVGIMDATPPFGPPKQFEPWVPLVYGNWLGFTVGVYVDEGAMTGWWFSQLWQ